MEEEGGYNVIFAWLLRVVAALIPNTGTAQAAVTVILREPERAPNLEVSVPNAARIDDGIRTLHGEGADWEFR